MPQWVHLLIRSKQSTAPKFGARSKTSERAKRAVLWINKWEIGSCSVAPNKQICYEQELQTRAKWSILSSRLLFKLTILFYLFQIHSLHKVGYGMTWLLLSGTFQRRHNGKIALNILECFRMEYGLNSHADSVRLLKTISLYVIP